MKKNRNVLAFLKAATAFVRAIVLLIREVRELLL
jgi:hypothetical protein